MFLIFIIQSGATWQKLITRTSLSRMLRGVQHNLLSLVKLIWTNCCKIDCSSVLKDVKIEAVHDLLEQQEALYLLPPPKKEVMFLVRSVCLFVCLSVGLLANL